MYIHVYVFAKETKIFLISPELCRHTLMSTHMHIKSWSHKKLIYFLNTYICMYAHTCMYIYTYEQIYVHNIIYICTYVCRIVLRCKTCT